MLEDADVPEGGGEHVVDGGGEAVRVTGYHLDLAGHLVGLVTLSGQLSQGFQGGGCVVHGVPLRNQGGSGGTVNVGERLFRGQAAELGEHVDDEVVLLPAVVLCQPDAQAGETLQGEAALVEAERGGELAQAEFLADDPDVGPVSLGHAGVELLERPDVEVDGWVKLAESLYLAQEHGPVPAAHTCGFQAEQGWFWVELEAELRGLVDEELGAEGVVWEPEPGGPVLPGAVDDEEGVVLGQGDVFCGEESLRGSATSFPHRPGGVSGSPGSSFAATLLGSELTAVRRCTAGLLVPGSHAGERQYGVSSRRQRWGEVSRGGRGAGGWRITSKPASRLGFALGPHRNLWGTFQPRLA